MPSSVVSNQDSTGTGKTTERIFPARRLVVKSPASGLDNPFDRLYGLRKAPKDADDAERDSISEGPEPPDEKQCLSETSQSCLEPDQDDEVMRQEFTQLKAMNSPKEKIMIQDEASTKPVEEVTSKDDLTTRRFSYITGTDGSFSIKTGLGNDDIQACEDEPIHTPGAVQGFGVLITLQQMAPGKYQVHHVSEVMLSLLAYIPLSLSRIHLRSLDYRQSIYLVCHLSQIFYLMVTKRPFSINWSSWTTRTPRT